MGGNGGDKLAAWPSVCPTSLPRIICRYNSGGRSLNSSNLHRVFVASTDLHKPSLFEIPCSLRPACAGGTTSVQCSPVPQKAEGTPHIPGAALHVIGPTRGPMFSATHRSGCPWEHLIAGVSLYPAQGCPYIGEDSSHVGFHALVIRFVQGQ